MTQVSIGKVDGFKRGNSAGTTIRRESADYMILKPYLDVLSPTTDGGFNLRVEICIIFYLDN